MSSLADALRGSLLSTGAIIRDDHSAVTGSSLLAEVDRLAVELRAAEIQRLATRIDNGIDWLATDIALQVDRRTHLPLPIYFSPEQIEHALETVAADGLLLPAGQQAGGEWVRVGRWSGVSNWLWQRRIALTPLPAETRLVTFTSGTTARPKGVCLSDDGLLQVAQALAFATRGAAVERHVSVLPLSTLLEQVSAFAALLAGASLVLPSMRSLGYSGASGLDVQRFVDTLSAARAQSVVLVPELLQGLITVLESGKVLNEALRFVAVGGAAVDKSLHRRAAALGLPVFEGYGLSECGSVIALNRPGAYRPGTVGQVLPHLRARLDERGELHVAGNHMLGYVGESRGAELDSELATGDLVEIDDAGFLIIRGRRKHQFITSFGRNIHPEWIEAALCAQSAIAQAMVHGEARPFNVAVLVPSSAEVSPEDLTTAVALVNAGLPDYARVSKWIIATEPFSVANGLLTGNGRLRRNAAETHFFFALSSIYASRPALTDTSAFIPRED